GEHGIPGPDHVLLAELEGTVLITAIIGIDGTSSAAQISRAIGLGLDEKALEALAAWRFRPGTSGGKPVPVMAIIPVEFRIAPKTSRWHLTGVTFHLAQGVERPHILSPKFPEGPGVSAREAMEEGSLLRAIRREAMAVVLFDIDESGVPVHLAIESASAEVWAPEALAVVRGWRFQPGMKEDQPVSVPCTFTLTWGGLKLAAN
ncbi:MAG: TonB family protein, partial [Bryobacteraceae bacterium]